MFNEKEYQKEYRKTHKNEIKEKNRLWRENNKEYCIKKDQRYGKIYYKNNKSKVDKHHRKYYHKTKGKWHKSYYLNNQLKIREYKLNVYYQFIRKELKLKREYLSFQIWEDDIIRRCYAKMFNKTIKELYLPLRSLRSIQKRANKLGLKKYVRFSEKHREVLVLRNKKNYGKTFEQIYGEEKAKQIKLKLSKNTTGENNPAYIHGKCREPYCLGWNQSLKDKIRQRDKRCVICRISNEMHKEIYLTQLEVHHIDGNKKNIEEDNLISLCIRHHRSIIMYYLQMQDYFHAKLFKLIN